MYITSFSTITTRHNYLNNALQCHGQLLCVVHNILHKSPTNTKQTKRSLLPFKNHVVFCSGTMCNQTDSNYIH